jgi:hypothetical protein
MIKIGFTGDIALSGIISDFSEEKIKDYLSLGGIVGGTAFVINLEAPVAAAGMKSPKETGVRLHCSGEALTSFLKTNNIAAVTLANNHALDYGTEGLRETISILDSFKIPHTGAGIKTGHTEPACFDLNGISYALLGYVHSATNPYQDESLFLNIYQKEGILAEIAKAKLHADRVVLSVHWGRDYSSFPREWQMQDAHEFIDNGADIIIGHHPHVIQPYEQYKGKYIFYSLGSTVFGDFYMRGRLRALPVKTKRSFIPVFADLQSDPRITGVRELRGNKLTTSPQNIERWSEKMIRRSRSIARNKSRNFLVDLKERYADRVFDVIFGYYRNPVKDIFSSEAIRNGLKILRKKN